MVQDHARLTLPGRRSRAVIAVAVVGFVALLFAWPMGALLRRAGTRSGFSDVVTDPHLRAVWWFTTWQAVLSGALAMLLGLPMAWLVSSSDTSVTRLIRGLATAAFVLPPVVVAIAMLRAVPGLGHEGVVPLVVAHAYVNLAVVIRVVGARWEVLDHDPTDAARLLGASPLRRCCSRPRVRADRGT